MIMEKDAEKWKKIYKKKKEDILGLRKAAHKESVGKNPRTPIKEELLHSLSQVMKASEESIESIKGNKTYTIGQKIPSVIKPCKKDELSTIDFILRHSSILNILIKWAEHLEFYFENAEEYIFSRNYPFKTIHNELVYLVN
jgi:hypothetical protein